MTDPDTPADMTAPTENQQLRERNAALEARVATVENDLDIDGQSSHPTLADN